MCEKKKKKKAYEIADGRKKSLYSCYIVKKKKKILMKNSLCITYIYLLYEMLY